MVYGMPITERFNPITGLMLGILVGGIIGTYAQRYFGTSLVIGAALGLLFGQWCKNQQKDDIEWIPRE